MAKNNKNSGNKNSGDDIFGSLFGALLGDEELPEEEVDKIFNDLQGLLGDLEDDENEADEDETDDDDDIEELLKELEID